MLDLRNETLNTVPFRPEKEAPDLGYTPLYRYGVVDGGAMRWLDVRPVLRPRPIRPVTKEFRKRLGVLAEELAARGVYYRDYSIAHDQLSDAFRSTSVPENFFEENAPIACSVSADEYESILKVLAFADPQPNDDKEMGLIEEYYSWELSGGEDELRIGHWLLPGGPNVSETEIMFGGGEIAGMVVDESWTGKVIIDAARTAGLVAKWRDSECWIDLALPKQERDRLATPVET